MQRASYVKRRDHVGKHEDLRRVGQVGARLAVQDQVALVTADLAERLVRRCIHNDVRVECVESAPTWDVAPTIAEGRRSECSGVRWQPVGFGATAIAADCAAGARNRCEWDEVLQSSAQAPVGREAREWAWCAPSD